MNSLGEMIRNLRRQRGLTQQQLASDLSVNRSTLANWELNRTQPDYHSLLQIADLFGVPVEFLLRGKLEGLGSEIVKVPVYQAKTNANFLEEQQIIGWEAVPACEVANGQYFILQVEDKSLTKMKMPPGAKVLVRKQDHVLCGKVALLVVGAGKVKIRRVKYYKKLIILYADEKDEPKICERNDVKIIGQIMEFKAHLD